jgi:type I restriction enzyme S subunit
LLVAARSTSLRSAIASGEHEGTLFNATLLRIRCQPDRLNPEYFFAWLSHPLGKEAVSSMSRSSTHQMSLTASALQDLMVPVPPIAEQRRLAEFLSAARQAHDAALAAATTRLALARELAFQSIVSP